MPTPLEVALARFDEVSHLLVALGADVNEILRDTKSGNRVTYLDYTRLVIKKIAAYKAFWLSSAEPSGNTPAVDDSTPSPELPSWKVEVQKIIATCNEVNAKQNASSKQQAKMFIDEIKAYFDKMDMLLTSHGGQTGEEPSALTEAQDAERQKNFMFYVPEVPGQFMPCHRIFTDRNLKFYSHTKSSPQAIMHSTLVTSYEELFTACYMGDNVGIQRLCLPHSAQKASGTPLQISVHWGNQWQGELYTRF